MEFKEKTLLVLAGKPVGTVDILEYAKQKGAYTIVTDNLNLYDSPGKALADEFWNISTADADLICAKALARNIDGVFTGIHEYNIEKAHEICHRLKLPFYATRDQLLKTSIKSEYKQLFRKFDIPVVEEYQLTIKSFEADLAKIIYPVLIKPVDGSGGYGISICYNEYELRKGFVKALDNSKSKRVIVEKFIRAKEVSIFYIIQNGNIMFSAIADRHTENGDRYTIPLPFLYTFPSVYLDSYQSRLNDKVLKAFKSLGLNQGMLFIQSFVENGEFKFYDIGFRLTGTQEYHLLEHLCGYNPLKMLVDFSLTGKMGTMDISQHVDPTFHGKCACILTFICKPGEIGCFVGLKEIETLKGVLIVIKNHPEGYVIPVSAIGTLNQVVLRIHGVADNKAELNALIAKILKKVDVLNIDGESILLSHTKVE